MTPDDFVSQIRAMVAAARHAEVLAFAEAERESVAPPLTPQQIVLVADILHIPSTIVAMEEHAAREATMKAEVA